jgi:hypothetical protein
VAKSKSPSLLLGPSTSDRARQLRDLRRLRGRRRVWFVYTHVHGSEERFLRRELLPRLGEIGTKIDEFDAPGAHAFLYRIRLRGGAPIP